MKKNREKFPQNLKDFVFKECIKKYKEAPQLLNFILPNVFEKLDKFKKNKNIKKPPPSIIQNLTPKEEELHIKKLNQLLEKYKKENKLSKEECLEMISHITALNIDKIENFEEIIKIISEGLNINFDEEKNKTINFKKGVASHRVNLVRGVKIYQTWDGKVVKIVLDKKKIKERKELMSFVGIGEDKEKDISIRHDMFFP